MTLQFFSRFNGVDWLRTTEYIFEIVMLRCVSADQQSSPWAYSQRDHYMTRQGT